MNKTLKLMAVGALALMISIPAAVAQTPEASTLPVTEPLQVGNTVLQPGTYMIRVLPSTLNRNKVQITSTDRSTVYATVLTVPHALEPNEEVPNTVFVFYPPVEGQPRALRTWFAQWPEASQGGHDIVYDETFATQLARATKSRVVAYPPTTVVADLDNAPLSVVTPEATVETYTYVPPAPAPVKIAETRPVEMPDTASRLPLVALLGLISLVGAAGFRLFRS
ncbi:MAG: hypothetical protein WA208_04050 [Thermoanaerobaculia bacterium]